MTLHWINVKQKHYMLSRRLFLKGLLASLTVPLLSRCSYLAPPLTIASHVWSGYELMFLAQREDWLSKSRVNLVDTLSATDSIQALLNDKVHGAALTLDEVLRVRARGLPLTCVLVFDVSAGADMVLSRTDVGNLADLAGKRIAFEESAVGALMLHELLQIARLSKAQIVPVPVSFDQHFAIWQRQAADVVITFEPVASHLLELGAYKIFDSRRMPDTIFDVLAIKTAVLQEQRLHIEHLIAAHFQARQYFYRNSQDATYKMAERMSLSAHEVLNSFRGLNLPNVQANEKYLSSSDSALLTAAKMLSALMLEQGSIGQEDMLEQLLDADFLPEIL